MHDDRTLVIFRKWRDSGSFIALFPVVPFSSDGWYCEAYEHVGQHGGADYHGVIAATRPVTLGEAAPLVEELSRVGYRLLPIKRASRRVHEARRSEAKRLRVAPV